MYKKTIKNKAVKKTKKNQKKIKKLILTPKQKMFIKEYLVDLNATQAAIRSGYSQKSANRIATGLLSKVNIQTEISKLISAREKKTEITAEYVLSGFKEIFERCAQRIPVMRFNKASKTYEQVTETVVDKDGNEREEGVWRFDSTGANTALSKLGEHLGLFKHILSNDPEHPFEAGAVNIIQLPSNGRENKK